MCIVVGLVMCVSSCSNNKYVQREENVGITDEEYCDQLRSSGAADAYINRNDGSFSYGVVEGQLTADPDNVARLMYDDAIGSGIRDIVECRVILLPDGKMIGRYKPE